MVYSCTDVDVKSRIAVLEHDFCHQVFTLGSMTLELQKEETCVITFTSDIAREKQRGGGSNL